MHVPAAAFSTAAMADADTAGALVANTAPNNDGKLSLTVTLTQ